jgi:hypothetical protein
MSAWRRAIPDERLKAMKMRTDARLTRLEAIAAKAGSIPDNIATMSREELNARILEHIERHGGWEAVVREAATVDPVPQWNGVDSLSGYSFAEIAAIIIARLPGGSELLHELPITTEKEKQHDS